MDECAVRLLLSKKVACEQVEMLGDNLQFKGGYFKKYSRQLSSPIAIGKIK